MVGRDVEGGEVVVVGFDLGPFFDPIAEASKNINDLFNGADQRVAVPRSNEAAGSGDIDGFLADALP